MPYSLESQINIVAFNIVFNISTKYRLIILPNNKLSSLINPEIAYKKIIIMSTDQLKSNDLRDVEEISILEHFFNIFPAFKKLCNSYFFYFLIFALQI